MKHTLTCTFNSTTCGLETATYCRQDLVFYWQLCIANQEKTNHLLWPILSFCFWSKRMLFWSTAFNQHSLTCNFNTLDLPNWLQSRVWTIFLNILIFEYICHKYFRTFILVKFVCTKISEHSIVSVCVKTIWIFIQFSMKTFIWTFLCVQFLYLLWSKWHPLTKFVEPPPTQFKEGKQFHEI